MQIRGEKGKAKGGSGRNANKEINQEDFKSKSFPFTKTYNYIIML